MAFSLVLRKLREERNVSQKEVAGYLGITRQAVSYFELGKREPDYKTLRKLADYFGVSVDFLLGCSDYQSVSTAVIGKNIELIKGNLTYGEFSDDIKEKTGSLIYPEMLELFVKGERMPFIGMIKILSKYASVRDTFFYNFNTPETYISEKELYKKEKEQGGFQVNSGHVSGMFDFIDDELLRWIAGKNNSEYIRFAREIQAEGISVNEMRSLVNTFLKKNDN